MSIVPIASEYAEIGKIVGDSIEAWSVTIHGDRHLLPNGNLYAEFYETKDEAEEAARAWDMPIRYDHAISTFVEGTEEYPPLTNDEVVEYIADAWKNEGILAAQQTARSFGRSWESVKDAIRPKIV